MNKSDIKVGQLWKSKNYFPNVGYYTVEILDVGYGIVKTKFTASEWEDKHWVEGETKIASLLNSYELIS